MFIIRFRRILMTLAIVTAFSIINTKAIAIAHKRNTEDKSIAKSTGGRSGGGS